MRKTNEAGPALPLVYLLAVIPLIPAMLSIIELGTALPRAGGVYYFLDRTLGPMVGTIGGMGTWLALVLKVAFALIGMGAYINLFFPKVEIIPFAIIIAIVLGFIILFGASSLMNRFFLLPYLLYIIRRILFFLFDNIIPHIILDKITRFGEICLTGLKNDPIQTIDR